MGKSAPQVRGFFDAATSTLSYLVVDPATKSAAIIDPVLDYEAKAARTTTASADRLVEAAAGLKVEWILETHTHADHLSAAPYVKSRLGGRIAIGAHVAEVQRTWKKLLNLDPDFRADGSQFEQLFGEGDRFKIGSLDVEVLHTPGHTPACNTYVVKGEDGSACAFVGDTLFMPDYGTARADFPGGDARQLFRSIRRILSLPSDTRVFVGHDYQPGGRPVAYEATVAEHRAANLHVKDGTTENAFVEFRTGRDRTLDMPTLLLPSIQVNIRAGRLPAAESNGIAYLKIPLNHS
jgi:glyoxylase-like metal-dependent hydrolase (beta-lactamase superfamily II)